MTVLHATAPTTVYLSCRARCPSATIADIDRALYDTRSLVKQLAMRRTVFVFPRDLLPAAWGSASARVAGAERRAMARDIVKARIASDGDAWLDHARAAVLDVLAQAPDGMTAAEIRRAAPAIDVKVSVSSHTTWSAPRVLTHLGLTADLARGANTSHWQISRPRWTLMRRWLDEVPVALSAADGYRELVRRYLRTFGPATVADIVWWLGSTRSTVRAALAELDAVPVELDSGACAWLTDDDVEPVRAPGEWVALLPVLDPTVMGWKTRDFYLARALHHQLFDSAGNAGTTAWANGRIVGCWIQDTDAVVRVRLLQPIAAHARRALEDEAAELTTWLDGQRVTPPIRSPAMKG